MQCKITSYSGVTKDKGDARPRIILKIPSTKRINRANLFDRLPIEMNQEIGHNLKEDQDVEAFRLSCRSANSAVDGDAGSFWRRRFLETYDRPAKPTTGLEYRKAYRLRKKAFRNIYTHHLCAGNSPMKHEARAIVILQSLLADASAAAKANPLRLPLNIAHVVRFINNKIILQRAGLTRSQYRMMLQGMTF
ncbi:Hypothetical predicted protein [Lecanosticta acicola]|uniref:F-box domain-containing protein n=1 Tax=Lecanosticta acicola TaxID=111012 RepID=A0AAI8Z4F9_9PEZI|nr:Hypothetical predicted protein [Lecanosticta acicola]